MAGPHSDSKPECLISIPALQVQVQNQENTSEFTLNEQERQMLGFGCVSRTHTDFME